MPATDHNQTTSASMSTKSAQTSNSTTVRGELSPAVRALEGFRACCEARRGGWHH